MRIVNTVILIVCCGWAAGQAPLIQSVAPINALTQDQVVISGSGFSNTPSQLRVIFGNTRANIVSSTDFSIVVDVPPQARAANVEVINLSTGLSGKSNLKFMESFGGGPFDPTKVSAPITFASTKELFDVCSCDFDLDGKPDLAANKFSNVDDPAATDLIVLTNQSTPGNLAFTKYDKVGLPNLNLNFPTINVNCGDLDGDGKPDLVATRTGGTKNVLFYLRNTNSIAGTPSFAAAQSLFLDAGQIAFRVSIHDINLDGKPELIVSNSFDDPATDNIIYVFVNQSTPGTISFNATPVKITATGANTSYGLDVQDIDGDKKPDIIVNQFNSSDVFILRNLSTNLIAFSAPVKIATGFAQINVTAADLNKDGLLDLVLASDLISNKLSVFINQSTTGNISFKPPSTFVTTAQPWGLDGSDVDGDGDVDIVVASKGDNFLNVFLNDGNVSPSFTRSDVATTGKFSRNLKVGDLDGDAKPDFAYTAVTPTNQFSLDIIRNTNCVSPKILNTPPVVICAAQTVTLKTTPAISVTFDWRESNVSFQSSTSPTADITLAGNYTVIATGEGGACVSVSPIFVVSSSAGTVPPNPNIISNAPVCVGGALTLSTNFVAGATYQWSGPAGFTSVSQSPTVVTVTTANAGIYKLQLAVGSCKSNEVSQNIDVASFPNFIVGSATPLPGCVTGVTLNVNSVAGYSYQWLKNSVATGQTTTTINVTTEGDYSVQATNIALSCTTESSKLTVQLYTVPVANFTLPATACTSAAVSFTNAATVDPRGTPAFAWTFGDAGTSTLASPTHNYAAAGPFNVGQTVSYAGVTGCSNTVTKPIAIVTGTVPVITAPSTQSCPGESVLLSVTGTFNTYAWSPGGGTASTFTVTQPGSYTVNTVDGNSCPGTGTYLLSSKLVPVVKASADKTSVVSGATVQLTATGADTYLWTPAANLDNPAIANPLASVLTTTTYKVAGTLTAGCSAMDSVKVTVSDATSLPAPVIFTPNGDTENDYWIIPGIENSPDCTMTIFDGHGSPVYEQVGYNNTTNRWDGSRNGNPLPDATYFYVFGCPNKKSITGTVMIKR